MDEAISRLRNEKIEAPIRALYQFLYREGLYDKDIQHFMITNNVSIKLMHNLDLRKLWRTSEKLYEAVKEID